LPLPRSSHDNVEHDAMLVDSRPEKVLLPLIRMNT
jgi:hypothetical protein